MTGDARRRLANLLVATDFSEGATHAIARAGRLPLADHARVTIAHVLHEGEGDATPELERAAVAIRAARPDATVRTALLRGPPHGELVRRARADHADLVVLGRHGRGRKRDALLGSTAERVVRSGETPILVVAAPPAGGYVRPMVAFDLDETARRALAVALRLIDHETAELIVVNAFGMRQRGDQGPWYVPDEELDEHRRRWEATARTAVDRFLERYRGLGLRLTTVVAEGDPGRVLLDQASARRPDLVVMGTHGRSAIGQLVIGSVTDGVLRAAPADILVARAVG